MQGTKGNPFSELWVLVLTKTVANLAGADLPVVISAQNYLSVSIQHKIYGCIYIYF